MKRRSFFRSLIAAPVAAVAGVVASAPTAKPLTVTVKFDDTELRTAIAEARRALCAMMDGDMHPVNKVRAWYGLNPIDGGDEYLVYVNPDHLREPLIS